MKKIFNWLIALPALFLLGACAPEEIVFDHEKPAFDTKDGQILLEVIVPSSTKADDVIYIAGAFNGGDEVAAENTMWHLEKSTTIDKKWGIYLDPTTFVEGKTLADGYHFVSVREGEERTALNKAVNRTESPAVGSRTNIYVSYWNMYFYVEPEIEHDGPVIYVNDQTGWDALALYAWGDAEAFGGWPGMVPTGSVIKDEINWTYFDLGEDVRGLNLNLIFNNNGGGSQLKDYNVTIDKDEYFLTITADGVQAANTLPSHDGTIRVYLDNQAGWETANLYMYGTVNDLGAGWPGLAVTGTATIAGVEYMYFEYEVDLVVGNEEHLIFNDGSKQIPSAQEPVITFSADVVDYFYVVYTDLTCAAVDPFDRQPAPDPGTGDEGGEGGEGEGGEGTEPEPTGKSVSFYIADNTGWDLIQLYSWGGTPNVEAFGGWPGASVAETITCAGTEYKIFKTVASAYGAPANLIFNNKVGDAGEQFDGPVVEAIESDYYFYNVTASAATAAEAPAVKVYVDDQTGWSTFQCYSWGGTPNKEVFGGWPGGTPATETVNGKEYKVFTVAAADFGSPCNLIFNNKVGDDGKQLSDYAMTADRDVFLTVTDTGVTVIE